MAGRFLGGQGSGKPAVFKSRATPANPGADADLAGGPGGRAPGQLAADRGQRAKHCEAQPVAQKLAAAGAGILRASVHHSAIAISLRHPEATGLPSFAQTLTFLGLSRAIRDWRLPCFRFADAIQPNAGNPGGAVLPPSGQPRRGQENNGGNRRVSARI
jgi:hypothetical protein